MPAHAEDPIAFAKLHPELKSPSVNVLQRAILNLHGGKHRCSGPSHTAFGDSVRSCSTWQASRLRWQGRIRNEHVLGGEDRIGRRKPNASFSFPLPRK